MLAAELSGGQARTAMPDSRSASRSGRSTIEKVLAPSITSRWAFGMVAASRLPSATSKNVSSADQAMSAGLSNSGSRAATPVVTSVRSERVS